MAGKLWVRLIHRNKTARDIVVSCSQEDWREALREACHSLDLSVPMIVPKHERDFDSYAQTRFLPEHFIDGLRWNRMEIEYFDPDAEKTRTSRDPRNG